jgi:hypothetical protein
MSEGQPSPAAKNEKENKNTDPLAVAIGAAAQGIVGTDYGPVPIAAALHSGDVNIWGSCIQRMVQLGQEIDTLIAADERFPKNVILQLRSVEGGGMQIFPRRTGEYLIRRTLDYGSPDEAIAWLLRVLAMQNATGRVIEALWGVPVAEETELSANLSILPVTALKDGPFKMLLQGHHQSVGDNILISPLGMDNPRSVLAVRTEISRVITPIDASDLPPAVPKVVSEAIEQQLQDITDLLTIVGPRVVVSAAVTFEFDDPDLHYLASLLSGRRARFIEVMPIIPTFNLPVLDSIEARELVTLFREIPESLRKKLRVALNRLNLAQRRFKLGDKAIDLAIVLESLLGGDETNEVTHKVTTRAARLLGGANEQRLHNRDIVNATYGYRSKMVHNGVQPEGMKSIASNPMPASEILSAAVRVCVAVIKRIIRLRQIPDWKAFDIEA